MNTRTTNAQLGSEAGARSAPTAATRWLMLAASALALGCSGESSDDEPSPSSLEEPLLADHAACKDGRLDTLANACLRATGHHQVTEVDLLAAVPTRPVLVGPTYSVRLAQNGDLSEGQAVFTPNVSGEYVFYLGTPNVPFSVERQGSAVTPICTRYISSTLATDLTGESCERVRGAYVAELVGGESYAVKFGPISARTVRLIIELRRTPGAGLRNVATCEGPSLSALGALCAQSTPTQPLRGTRMDEVDAADVSVGQAYGVHLQSLGGENEASVEFVPPYTGDYLIGLGTPNVGLHLRAADAEVAPSCAISVTTDLADTLGAGDCSAIKGVFSARLSGGVSTRLELGRTAAGSWERLVIVPAAPDSDGDGLADNLDGCPADTSKVEPGICGCGVSDEGPDSEGDGIPDHCDVCAGENTAVEEDVQSPEPALQPLPPTIPVEEVIYSSVSALPAPTQILPESGVPNQDARYQVFLSRAGRYVTFSSDASNLVPSDTNGTTDVFRVDRSSGRFVRVSVGDSGGELSGKHVGVAASDNGCKVAFITLASDSSETQNQNGPLRVWDCGSRTSVEVEPDIVLPATLTPTAFDRGGASFSSDGTWLAFGATLLNLGTLTRTALPMQTVPWLPPTTFVTGNGGDVLFEDFFTNPLGVKAYQVATANLQLLWGSTQDFDITSFRQLQDTSQNGNVFAFGSSFYPALNYELWENAFVADIKAGTVLQLSVDPNVDSPCTIANDAGYSGSGFFTRVSGDGSTAAFATCSSVDVVNLATRTRQRFQWPATSKWGPQSLDLSADGKHLAFITPTTLGSDPHPGTEPVPVPASEAVSGPGNFGRDVFVIDLVPPCSL